MSDETDRTDDDREFAAITEAQIWEEARDRLKICIDAESDNRKRAKDSIMFREGDQWDHSTSTTASEDEPELTINLTDALVRRVENNIRQQRPRGKCHPVGDGADVEIAEILNGIGRHVETRSDASVAYDQASTSSLDAGWGYFRLVAEFVDRKSFQKDLRILPIRNVFTVFMDPGAIMPAGNDQNWNIISIKMPRQEYKRRYPRAENRDWADLSRDDLVLDWEDKESVRLAEYFRLREKAERLFLFRGQGGEEFTKYRSELPRGEDGKLLPIEAVQAMIAERGLRIDGDRESSKMQVEWFRLNGRKVVEREQLPGIYIPVFRVEGNVKDIDGRIIRKGMVENLMDPARMVNYGEVAKIKRLGLAPKAPWVAAEGQLDGHPEWDDANQKAYSVLTYKPVVIETSSGPVMPPPPARQPPAQIEAGFSEFVQQMRTNLMAVANMQGEPGMDKAGEVVSGEAYKRRQFLSDQAHFQYFDNLTLAITQCWRVMVSWIPIYMSEPGRIQRIIGEDSTPEMVTLNERTNEGGIEKIKNDLSVGRYDVVMDTGPGYDSKREEGAENLLKLLDIPALAEMVVKLGADLVFRSIDHPYMQELADRVQAANPDGLEKIMEGLSGRAKSIVQALANEVQALQQKNQELEQEQKFGMAKAHMAAVTKAHDTEVRAESQRQADDTKRMDIAVSSHTELAKEEIRAGASLLNTHAEAKHHKEEAERMIEDAQQAEAKQ
jgi:hypothetical protein